MAVGVGTTCIVGVGVAVATGVGVRVGVGVGTGAGVGEGVKVGVGTGVAVGMDVGVTVGVAVGAGVLVGRTVGVGVGGGSAQLDIAPSPSAIQATTSTLLENSTALRTSQSCLYRDAPHVAYHTPSIIPHSQIPKPDKCCQASTGIHRGLLLTPMLQRLSGI